jgi:hypothetical protein
VVEVVDDAAARERVRDPIPEGAGVLTGCCGRRSAPAAAV